MPLRLIFLIQPPKSALCSHRVSIRREPLKPDLHFNPSRIRRPQAKTPQNQLTTVVTATLGLYRTRKSSPEREFKVYRFALLNLHMWFICRRGRVGKFNASVIRLFRETLRGCMLIYCDVNSVHVPLIPYRKWFSAVMVEDVPVCMSLMTWKGMSPVVSCHVIFQDAAQSYSRELKSRQEKRDIM